MLSDAYTIQFPATGTTATAGKGRKSRTQTAEQLWAVYVGKAWFPSALHGITALSGQEFSIGTISERLFPHKCQPTAIRHLQRMSWHSPGREALQPLLYPEVKASKWQRQSLSPGLSFQLHAPSKYRPPHILSCISQRNYSENILLMDCFAKITGEPNWTWRGGSECSRQPHSFLLRPRQLSLKWGPRTVPGSGQHL